MFAAALLCQVILATAAFAIPTANERLARRAARRAAGLIRQSLSQPVVSEVNGLDNATQPPVAYSFNWAGAFVSENTNTATYKEVTGTFLLPTPKVPSGGSGAYQAAAWVGIDGATCAYTLFEAGIDFAVNGSSVSYHAWYNWDPNGADFSDIALKAGDIVTVTVEATSSTNGTAWIKNHTTGKRVSHNFTGQSALCQYDADWIVQELGNSSVTPLANFTKVDFTHATAHTLAGKTVGPANAQRLDIVVNKRPVTQVTTGADSVTVIYTGK